MCSMCLKVLSCCHQSIFSILTEKLFLPPGIEPKIVNSADPAEIGTVF